MRIKFTNHPEVKAHLKNLMPNVRKEAHKALNRELVAVYEGSQKNVPVRLAHLKKSGAVEESKGDKISGSVGYGHKRGTAFYAAIVEGKKQYLRKAVDKERISAALRKAILKGAE